jgi:hypothetical protein
VRYELNSYIPHFSIVVMGGCLVIAWILLACLPSRYQATHVPSRDRSIATVLHATIIPFLRVFRVTKQVDSPLDQGPTLFFNACVAVKYEIK